MLMFFNIYLSKLNNFDGSEEVLFNTGHPARQHSRIESEIRSKAISKLNTISKQVIIYVHINRFGQLVTITIHILY